MKDLVDIISYTENPDGSTNIEMELDPAVVQMLINQGFNKVLQEHCEKIIDENEGTNNE